MLEVLPRGVDVVGLEGAAGAALLPAGAEHEVLHEELAAPGEEIAQRNRPLGPLEDVVLLDRSEEHTSELQPLMRNSYAVFCLKKKNNHKQTHNSYTTLTN